MPTNPATSLIDAIECGNLSPDSLDRLSDDEFQNIEAELCNELDTRCSLDPLYWAQTWTYTENPKWREQGLEFRSRFPRRGYFDIIFARFRRYSRLFCPKTREMMTSWCAMVWAAHQAQWFKSEVIVQTDAEQKAKELVGYAQCLYRNQEFWLKERHPISELSDLKIAWQGGGRVFGIPKGEHKIRLYHPTIYIMDEAAFLPEAQQCYDTAHPVAGQIIAISSAGPGWFGNECEQV